MPATGRLCETCATAARVERVYGTVDETPDWGVDQQGLGDSDPEGQATLDGALVRGESDE
jgi:hypothetical protein